MTELIGALGLVPHIEGGHWAQTWIGPPGADGRPVGTAIVYLLNAGETSRWHRVDATEVWHFHAGAPLVLRCWNGRGPVTEHRLGIDIDAGERPQVVVDAGVWQAAVTTGAYTLAGCTVAPGFVEAGFEIAPIGWAPPGAEP
jgi:uncharacterized protein